MKFHTLLPQDAFRYQQILAFGVPPERDHVRMLAKQQHVLDRVSLARRDEAFLQFPRFRVADQTQIHDQAFIQHRPSFFVGRSPPPRTPLQAGFQTLICNPLTLANASPIASHTVGCACTMFIMSSMVPSRFRTAAASDKISVASGPMM